MNFLERIYERYRTINLRINTWLANKYGPRSLFIRVHNEFAYPSADKNIITPEQANQAYEIAKRDLRKIGEDRYGDRNHTEATFVRGKDGLLSMVCVEVLPLKRMNENIASFLERLRLPQFQ